MHAICYCTHTESRETALKDAFPGQQWRNRHKRTDLWKEGRGGESEMYGERKVETYITVCKTDSQWELLCDSGNSNRLCINLEGWDGREMGGRLQREGIYVRPMAGTCYCPTENNKLLKAIILQLKN